MTKYPKIWNTCKYCSWDVSQPSLSPVFLPKDLSYWGRIKSSFGFNSELWVLNRDWYVDLPNGVRIVFFKDFVTDGASFPKLTRPIFSPTGIFFVPGLFHDFACRYDKLIGVKYKDGKEIRYDYLAGAGRAYWDNAFMCLSTITCGIHILPKGFWAILRCFGWIAWNRYRRMEREQIY